MNSAPPFNWLSNGAGVPWDHVPALTAADLVAATAAEVTRGGRQEAAKLLGWGRNTLTRKLKELRMDDV